MRFLNKRLVSKATRSKKAHQHTLAFSSSELKTAPLSQTPCYSFTAENRIRAAPDSRLAGQRSHKLGKRHFSGLANLGVPVTGMPRSICTYIYRHHRKTYVSQTGSNVFHCNIIDDVTCILPFVTPFYIGIAPVCLAGRPPGIPHSLLSVPNFVFSAPIS